MWLCAGTTSLINLWFSFKYSNQEENKVTVTKLKLGSQSAGNLNNSTHALALLRTAHSNQDTVALPSKSADIEQSTSETLRCKSGENIKKVSVHVPIHIKPNNEFEFGHYLAGLIDGDGHFSKTPQIVIVFNELDSSLAYFIKGKIGYGNVYKVKGKKAVILVIANHAGICKVIELINGKIRSNNKLNQINNNILSNSKFKILPLFTKNYDSDLNNYWLAGFSDADASFQIKLINKNEATGRTEVRLNFQIDQKNEAIAYDLLNLINKFLGGNIGYRKNQDTYYYESSSFACARKVINYLDRYHLLSHKHVNYLKWRKAYIIIQNKEHLTLLGLNKITKLKTSMNRSNSDNPD